MGKGEVDRVTDRKSPNGPDDSQMKSLEQNHEEQSGIRHSYGFQYSEFMDSLEDRHQHRIDDSEDQGDPNDGIENRHHLVIHVDNGKKHRDNLGIRVDLVPVPQSFSY